MRPDVIVDIVFRDGLLFVVIENIGDQPAVNVRVEFEPKLAGQAGTLELASMPLFRDLLFLAPRRRIAAFLGMSAAFFNSGQPTRVAANIAYADRDGKSYQSVIRHDLGIYRNLGYVPGDPLPIEG